MSHSIPNFNLKRASLPLLIKVIVVLCIIRLVDAKNLAFEGYGTIITLTSTQLLALNRLNLNQARNWSERCSTLELHPNLSEGTNKLWENETQRTLDETNGAMDTSLDPCLRPSESFEGTVPTLVATSPNFLLFPGFNQTPVMYKNARQFSHKNTDTDVDSVNVKHVYLVDGRIFKKKIKNFFKNKLLLSFIALLVIIKLIKIKLFWLLPIIVGVGTAKKLLLNFILFLFPALSHLFKLCSTYHAEHLHDSKYHLHQHKTVHHYAIHPDWRKGHGSSSSVFIPNRPELIFTRPPKGYLPIFHHNAHAPAAAYYRNPSLTTDWEASGPGLGTEYFEELNRNDNAIEQNKLHTRVNELKMNKLHSTIINRSVKNINKGDYSFAPQLISKKEKFSLDSFADDNASKGLPWSNIFQGDARINKEGNEQLEIVPTNFFSNALQKIDEIFLLFGPLEEICKTLLVCRMYQNPNKFRPYSNFMSAELSRDTNDLKKPTTMNDEMLRFFKFVEAAKIGQEEKDCSHLLNQCSAVQVLPSW